MGDITPKILTKELRELEDNGFVARKVLSTRPVTVLYELTPYSRSLDKVLEELRNWGMQHRQKIMHPLSMEGGEATDHSTDEQTISTLFQQ
jgi:DNA-binding HxlR family transcriptional regulator